MAFTQSSALLLHGIYDQAIEIKDFQVITSYTRWVDAVQMKGTTDNEVYLTFSPRFMRLWLESKRRLLDLSDPKAGGYRTSQPVCPTPLHVGETPRPSWNQAYHRGRTMTFLLPAMPSGLVPRRLQSTKLKRLDNRNGG
ncbi:MAG TPA: hypothetical protein VK673_09250 [Chthoniobacterales bacterium]|nr:hypothetical protein [Chthoniobacterales bacterium]